jgi:hypothetical protein
MIAARSTAELRRRLGPADLQQIRALLRVPPEQRIETMLDMQAVVLNMWSDRLRQSHPELDDLALTRLVFTRLYQNG